MIIDGEREQRVILDCNLIRYGKNELRYTGSTIQTSMVE